MTHDKKRVLYYVSLEKNVPFTSRTPTYLTPEQRHLFTEIPADLSDREIARYYTFSQKDLELIKQRRRLHNRLGFAVQLAVLRFPGRPLKDLTGIPSRVLAAIKGLELTEVFATLRRGGEEIAETTVAHIAPLGWEHINLIGNYHFAPQPGRSLDNLRPLRLSVSKEEKETTQEVAD
jgi:hypothetical protein